jgi:phosphoribosylanthranilate isomerase
VLAFRIKVCGITSVDDARLAVEAGADALGLNFYAKSPRRIGLEMAREITAALAGRCVVRVGLFVNHTADEVCRTFDQLALDLVQLHGDEPPEFLTALGDRPVMRALRVGPAGLAPVLEYLDRCGQLGRMPAWVLLDTFSRQTYGGSGEAGDWNAMAQYARPGLPPLTLAGGLTPENVTAAIRAVHPMAVDVASGVETSPGRKDAQRVRQFVARARAAFDAK